MCHDGKFGFGAFRRHLVVQMKLGLLVVVDYRQVQVGSALVLRLCTPDSSGQSCYVTTSRLGYQFYIIYHFTVI
jgi:hypothetical protein